MDNSSKAATPQEATKKSFASRLFSGRKPLHVALIAGVLVLLLGGSAMAIAALTNDNARFRSTLSAEKPAKQHLLQVDGSGELVAKLRDRTENEADKVRYNLVLENEKGDPLARVVSNTAGGKINLIQNVEPGVYTFIVSSEDPLTETGASYQLNIDYPSDVADFDDKTAPELQILGPALGDQVEGIFTISGTASDNEELDQVAVRLDSGTWVASEQAENWSVDIDSAKFTNGQYIIEAQAADASGNTTIERILVNFDNPSPDPVPDPNPNPAPDPTPDPTPTPEPTPDSPTDPGQPGGGVIVPPDTENSSSFFDDFSTPGWQERFDFDIYHRDDFVVAGNTWFGDHAPASGNDPDACTAPEEQRTISRGVRPAFNNDWIYRCAPGDKPELAHLMTSIGDVSGYSIGMFTPKNVFNGISEVSWEQNITDLGFRQFTEIAVIPADKLVEDDYPCQDGFPCNSATYANTGAIGVSFNGDDGGTLSYVTPDAPAGDEWNLYADGHPTCKDSSPVFCFGWNFDAVAGGSDPALESIRTRRTFVMKDNGNNTITLSAETANGDMQDLVFPGSFPSGDVRVLFKDHNYTPSKDNPGVTFTWHWDNISVK